MNENNLFIIKKKTSFKNFKIYFNKKKLLKLYNKINCFIVPILLIYIICLSLKDKKIFKLKNLDNKINMKICLCTLGKNENKYIKEFVEYYKNYGVDKIILYDNNDINGEKFEEIIGDYIKQGFVHIENWRGMEKMQFKIMNDCYKNNFDKFDWLIFYDIDEFIFLKNYTNIKMFLNQPKFSKCGKIELNWIHRVNEKLIYYDNRPLSERFKEKEFNIMNKNINFYPQIKSILKGHIPNIHIGCLHRLTSQVEACDGYGRKSQLKGIKSVRPDYENYYINHYFGKSLEEFIEKSTKGSAAIGKNNLSIMAKINRYFERYKVTKEKLDYIENKTGMNLSLYRKNLT